MGLSEIELERLADRIADKMISNFEKEGLVLSRKELAKQAHLKERVLKKAGSPTGKYQNQTSGETPE